MTGQPRCPHCRGNQLYYDRLEREWACLACGWCEPPRVLLGLVVEPALVQPLRKRGQRRPSHHGRYL